MVNLCEISLKIAYLLQKGMEGRNDQVKKKKGKKERKGMDLSKGFTFTDVNSFLAKQSIVNCHQMSWKIACHDKKQVSKLQNNIMFLIQGKLVMLGKRNLKIK